MNRSDLRFNSTCNLYLNEGILGGLGKIASKMGKITSKINDLHAATVGKDASIGKTVGVLTGYDQKKKDETKNNSNSITIGNDGIIFPVWDEKLAVYRNNNKTPADIYYVDIDGNKKVVYKCTACTVRNRPSIQTGTPPGQGWAKLPDNDPISIGIIDRDDKVRGTNLQQISADVNSVLGV